MEPLALRDSHLKHKASFLDLNGKEAVADYGDAFAEHAALTQTVGLIDLSFRSRICLLGADRQRFLNGQVTNNVKDLKVGEWCYAALVNHKGKMQSDLNIYHLENEILLDFEPGMTQTVMERLDKFIIADDVQMVDVAPHYAHFSLLGPKALPALPWPMENRTEKWVTLVKDDPFGECYCARLPRLESDGYDLFVPSQHAEIFWETCRGKISDQGGKPVGWTAFNWARVEAGIPRFGVDMDEQNLPPEAGLDTKAISYTKGCYTGQEVIARIRTYGQVAKALRGLVLPNDLKIMPKKGDKLFLGPREVGYLTSAVASPAFKKNLALGYVRREANRVGTELRLKIGESEVPVQVVELPFKLEG